MTMDPSERQGYLLPVLATTTMVGLSAMSALAQGASGDPSAPIDFLKTAQAEGIELLAQRLLDRHWRQQRRHRNSIIFAVWASSRRHLGREALQELSGRQRPRGCRPIAGRAGRRLRRHHTWRHHRSSDDLHDRVGYLRPIRPVHRDTTTAPTEPYARRLLLSDLSRL